MDKEMSDEEAKKGLIITGIAMVCLLGVFIVASYFMKQGNKPAACMIAGAPFALMFFLLLFLQLKKGKFDKELFAPMGITFLGCILVVFGAVFTWGSEEIKHYISDHAVSIAGAAFVIMGMTAISQATKDVVNYIRWEKVEVEARIIKVEKEREHIGGKHVTFHVPTYLYTYNGVDYKKKGGNGNNGQLGVGAKVKIKIKKDVPDEVMDVDERTGAVILYILGIVFVAAGIALDVLSPLFQ